jgi:protein-tyrosine-phosphatase
VKVAFVCTGNRFRSPLAAALMEEKTRGLPVEIMSLGILELGPEPALLEAIEIARGLGLELRDHRARSIADVDLGAFELVLGFERMHLLASVVDANAAIERTFTLPELIKLLGWIPGPPLPSDPVERARVRLRQAHLARPPDFRSLPMPELADPLGKTVLAQREIGREIVSMISHLSRGLFG